MNHKLSSPAPTKTQLSFDAYAEAKKITEIKKMMIDVSAGNFFTQLQSDSAIFIFLFIRLS